jgi:hypothetical protein
LESSCVENAKEYGTYYPPETEKTNGNLTPKESIMQKLELHPYCILFPACTAKELQTLTEDIRQNGLLDPIVLFDGKILDGRNRYMACQQSNTAIQTVEFTGDDPLAFVLSKNLHRRQLTESQRAAIAAEIANMSVGRNWRNSNSANLRNNNSLPEKELCQGDSDATRISQKEAAKIMNVSERSVSTAKKVLKEATPEVIQQVKEGKKTLHAALPERKQKPPAPPRRKNIAEEQEPDDGIEYLKIPLPLDYMSMATVFGRRFQRESEEFKENILRELDLFHDMIQNLRCD